VLLSVLLGLVSNEIGDVSPWLARRVVRWSAARWSADADEAAVLAEEWSALLGERPGKLFKLFTALGFAARATVAQQHRRLDAVLPRLRGAVGSRSKALLLVSTGVVAAALLVGTVRIGAVVSRLFTAYPVATLTAIALFALLAVPFWLLIRELDFFEREPIRLLVVAFAWGGLVATAVSIPASAALDSLLAKLGSPGLAADWGAALAGPIAEEPAKALGVVAIVLIARHRVNSVLDGIIYGAMVGLGFQIIEDVVFAVGAVSLAGHGDRVEPVVTTFLLRGFLSGVWSHTLFTALAGAGIGYFVVRGDRRLRHRIGVALLAVFAAWAAHVLWNSPLLADSVGDGGLALLVVLLVKGLPPLMLLLLLVRRAHDQEADYYTALLATAEDPRLVTPAELAVLRSGPQRASARRNAAARAGRRASAAVRRLQRAQAQLAVALSRAEPRHRSRTTPCRPTARKFADNGPSWPGWAIPRRSPPPPRGGTLPPRSPRPPW